MAEAQRRPDCYSGSGISATAAGHSGIGKDPHACSGNSQHIRKVVVLERDHIPIVFFKVSNESLVLFLSKSCFPFLQTIIKMSSKGLFFFFPRAV